MFKIVENSFPDFSFKPQEISNSTTDGDSNHYEPIVYWEPTWTEVESK